MKIISLLPKVDFSPELPVALAPYLSFPDSAIVRSGNPVFLPDFDDTFSASFFLAIKISRLGKSISGKFASRYFAEVAPAMAITAVNLLDFLRGSGLPWGAATGFDKSVAIGDFFSYDDNYSEKLILEITPNTKDLESAPPVKIPLDIPSREDIHNAICEASRYNSLKMGDLILISLDFPALQLQIDSLIKFYINEDIILRIPIK